MDSALELRMLGDDKKLGSFEEAKKYLDDSLLLNKLTASFIEKPTYAVWRLIALSEIPYTKNLEYTQTVIEYIERKLSTSFGFTLTGKEADMLPCYNAMLLEAYIKLGLHESLSAQNALNWIKQYQPFERNKESIWRGKGVKKYGGCLKSTPCFIGIVKSVKALSCYDEATGGKDQEVSDLLAKGMEYILKHRLYRRLSDGEAINTHILDLAFPASYQLNIVELLDLANRTGKIEDKRCESALNFVEEKRTKEGFWKINYIYKADGFVSFDQRGEKGEWITYLLDKSIAGRRGNG